MRGGPEPLESIEAFGEEDERDNPISLRGRRDSYFYIKEEDYKRLKEINEAYAKVEHPEAEPLSEIEIIGRGGKPGFKPFILPNRSNRYLCIPADQLRQLEKVNDAYRKRLEEKRKEEERKKKAKEKIESTGEELEKLEEKQFWKFAEEKAENARNLFEKMSKTFEEGDYEKTLKLYSEVQESIEKAVEEAEKTKEEAERAEKMIGKVEERLEKAKEEKAPEYVPEKIDRAEKAKTNMEDSFEEEKYEKALNEAEKAEELAKSAIEKAEKFREKEKDAKEKIHRVEKRVEEVEDSIPDDSNVEPLNRSKELLEEMKESLKSKDFEEVENTYSEATELVKEAEEKREEAEEKQQGKYVYCVIPKPEEEKNFGRIGIENDSEVYTIAFKDLAAVVSDVPFKKGYKVKEEEASTHNQVIQEVMEDHTVVPMSFGMNFKSEKILKNVLKKIYSDLKEAVKKVKGEIELGLKIITSEDAEFDPDELASDLKTLPEIADRSQKGERFSDNLLLNASYLVPEEDMEEFSNEIDNLVEKYPNLDFQYSGPWPPFSFVNIQVGKGE